MNQFRRDPLSDRWTILAPLREARPNQFAASSSSTSPSCPFCAQHMDTPSPVAIYGERETSEPWRVCVVPNRYPVMTPDPGAVFPEADGLSCYDQAAGAGFHEVVIESPQHVEHPGDLSERDCFWMLVAYRDRMQAMRDQGVIHVLPMKNYGAAAGASLTHSHSQLFGLPFTPPQIELELRQSLRFWDQQQACLLCRLVSGESDQSQRLVYRDDDYCVWCPFASRFPYETWIAPVRHKARYETSDDESLAKLGSVLLRLLKSFAEHERIDAFNYYVHSLPFDSQRHDHYHWHIEILPRINKAAGFEWGTGVHINTVPPEEAAQELREGLGS